MKVLKSDVAERDTLPVDKVSSGVKKRSRNVLQKSSSCDKDPIIRNLTANEKLSALDDSNLESQREFARLVSPTSIYDFLQNYHEKRPLLHRHPDDYFKNLFSIAEFHDLVCSKKLTFGEEIDVTKYTSGKKSVVSGTGLVTDSVWNQYENYGCSLRLLRPQEFDDALWGVLARLEEFFGCMWGANAYLTPGKSQGFAPHFDDVDAYVCQVEGRKKWTVYAPRDDGFDVLPRHSSVDFAQKKLPDILMEVMLEAGDMLYMPRGVIHQAECVGGEASLHITLSTGQRWTWADFLIDSFKTAVESAAARDVFLRKSLPLQFDDYMGSSPRIASLQKRQKFIKNVQTALNEVKKHFPVDAAADSMISRFMYERLPLPPKRLSHSHTPDDIHLGSRIRLVSGSAARLSMREGSSMSYLIHCVDNRRDNKNRTSRQHWMDHNASECASEETDAINFIIRSYPNDVQVGEIPLSDEGDRLILAEAMVLDVQVCVVVG